MAKICAPQRWRWLPLLLLMAACSAPRLPLAGASPLQPAGAALEVVWLHRQEGATFSWPLALAADQQGNSYLLVERYDAADRDPETRFVADHRSLILKFGADGRLHSRRQLPAGMVASDLLRAPDGTLYLSGQRDGRAVVARYDADLTLRWLRVAPLPVQRWQLVAADDEAVWLVARGEAHALVRLSGQGELQQIALATVPGDTVGDALLDEAGLVLAGIDAAGALFVARYDVGGAQLWRHSYAVQPLTAPLLAQAPQGLYVAGSAAAPWPAQAPPAEYGYDLFVAQLASDGVLQWVWQQPAALGLSSARALVVDAQSTVYLAGEYGNYRNASGTPFLAVLSAAGGLLALVPEAVRSGAAEDHFAEARALALAPDGQLIMAGAFKSFGWAPGDPPRSSRLFVAGLALPAR